MSLRILGRQLVSYGAVGVLALLVDWACLVALTWCGFAIAPANLAARVSGAGIAYLLNGMLTFRDRQGSRLGWRRFLRFALAWCVMTAISTVALQTVQSWLGLHSAWLAKPVVEVVLAGLSFLAYRHWIYK